MEIVAVGTFFALMNITSLYNRGAAVDWLEQLGCGAESRRKARVRGWASSYDDWKTLSVNPAVNGYLFELGKEKGSERRRGMSCAFHHLCPRYRWTLNLTDPTAIRLWETFTYNIRVKISYATPFSEKGAENHLYNDSVCSLAF